MESYRFLLVVLQGICPQCAPLLKVFIGGFGQAHMVFVAKYDSCFKLLWHYLFRANAMDQACVGVALPPGHFLLRVSRFNSCKTASQNCSGRRVTDFALAPQFVRCGFQHVTFASKCVGSSSMRNATCSRLPACPCAIRSGWLLFCSVVSLCWICSTSHKLHVDSTAECSKSIQSFPCTQSCCNGWSWPSCFRRHVDD